MTRRSDPVQGPPPDDLSAFPGWVPAPVWFRAHTERAGADGGCWFFASAPPDPEDGGRFDLPAPHGTCYVAETEHAAAREAIATPGKLVDERRVAGKTVAQVTVLPVELADLLSEDAANHGVTGELTGRSPYAVGQVWAAALHKAGFEGMRYQPRFSTDRVDALALFSDAGAQPGQGRGVHRPLKDVVEEMGVQVVPAPSSKDPGMTWHTMPPEGRGPVP